MSDSLQRAAATIAMGVLAHQLPINGRLRDV